jgi:dTDP-4-dehydrorhamnose reductase
MKILILGADGQVGKEIAKINTANQLVLLGSSNGDITNIDLLKGAVFEAAPEVIINCAAYTAVDKAEENTKQAFLVNETGAKNIAQIAKEVGAKLIHISTDYVFGIDANRKTPYKEEDVVGPINVYGQSKLAGEEAIIKEYGQNALIVRTSSVHGVFGANFVHTMLRLMAERPEVRVVGDQVMSTTWAGWLAVVLLELAKKDFTGFDFNIINASTSGELSWYDFAAAIRELATFPEQAARVVSITTAEYPLPAKRPAYSVLDCARLEEVLPGIRIDWLSGLKGHLKDLEMLH